MRYLLAQASDTLQALAATTRAVEDREQGFVAMERGREVAYRGPKASVPT